MKNEKLELLLNKVVEYNRPDEIYVKGFLYKDYSGQYYLKIVETLLGSLTFNQKHYLKEGDEVFIKQADKPKLMRVSLKSWHYRLIKYVMRDNAPTPKTMQNGCPYFWILVFSMFVVPFILLFKALKWTVLLVPRMLFWVLEQMVESWVVGLDDEVAYDMNHYGIYANNKLPKTAKIYFSNNNSDSFFDFFLSKKYKNLNPDDKDYAEKKKEMQEKWEKWREDLDKRREDLDKRREEQYKLHSEKLKQREEIRMLREEKAKRRAEYWEVKTQPIREGFRSIGTWFKKTFTVERGRVNMIVKRTKQFVGTLVTLLILTTTFVAVNYIALGLIWFIDLCIANWFVFAAIGVLAILASIGYLLYVLLTSWLQNVLNKYERGKKVWYIQPFIYLIFYPLKYIIMAIAWVVVKVLWEILKFVFYTVLFKHFLKPIGLFIAKVFVGLWKGIASSSGIFGEYFGASYSDYCPGIEWCDIDDE